MIILFFYHGSYDFCGVLKSTEVIHYIYVMNRQKFQSLITLMRDQI